MSTKEGHQLTPRKGTYDPSRCPAWVYKPLRFGRGGYFEQCKSKKGECRKHGEILLDGDRVRAPAE